MQNDILDLCDESESEYDDLLRLSPAVASSPSSVVIYDDKDVYLWGISIGTYAYHWTAKCNPIIRPKLVLNERRMRMRSGSFDICLQSNAHIYRKINIKSSNINKIIIPRDSSFFATNRSEVAQYLNVFFLSLHASFTSYPWLSAHFKPRKPGASLRKKLIMIVIDANNFKSLASILLSAAAFKDKTHIILNKEKALCLKQFVLQQSIAKQWLIVNKRETMKRIKHLLDDDNKENDYTKYIENNAFIQHPHHDNALLFVQNKIESPYYDDERCYWYFPKQHKHKEEVFVIRQTHYDLVARKYWLNDEIVNFMMKYIYSSFPSCLKSNIYVFNSFFFTALKPMIRKKNDMKPNNKEMIRIQKQTRYFDNIFDRDYIIIPICDEHHWELAIISHHGMIFNEQNSSPHQKCSIVILDSLNYNKTEHKDMFKVFKRWLNLQSNFAGKSDKLFNSKTVATAMIQVPNQPNEIDCGCFLLKNLQKFGQDGDLRKIVTKRKKWYSVSDGVGFRYYILQIMNALKKEQQKYVRQLYEQKMKKN